MKSEKLAYIKIIIAMLIWGSLPVFVGNVSSLTSLEIVFCRVVIGLLFLLAVIFFSGKKPNRAALRKHGIKLLITGVFMGSNWLLLFESYRFTDSGVSTLIYYLAPVFVMIGARIVYKSKISPAKGLSAAFAVAGMVVITNAEVGGSDPAKGILLALLSALFYAGVTLSNKSVSGLSGIESTAVQLVGAFIVVCPAAFIMHDGGFPAMTSTEVISVIILGLVHSGIALSLYFGAVQLLPSQTSAILSYLDPASTIVFTTLILKEELTVSKIIGAVLIIGGALFGELFGRRKKV